MAIKRADVNESPAHVPVPVPVPALPKTPPAQPEPQKELVGLTIQEYQIIKAAVMNLTGNQGLEALIIMAKTPTVFKVN